MLPRQFVGDLGLRSRRRAAPFLPLDGGAASHPLSCCPTSCSLRLRQVKQPQKERGGFIYSLHGSGKSQQQPRTWDTCLSLSAPRSGCRNSRSSPRSCTVTSTMTPHASATARLLPNGYHAPASRTSGMLSAPRGALWPGRSPCPPLADPREAAGRV